MAEKYFLLSEIEKDFDWLKSRGSEDIQFRELIERLENGVIPAADVQQVVHCNDCRWGQMDDLGVMHCHKYHMHKNVDGFCDEGERKEPENENTYSSI